MSKTSKASKPLPFVDIKETVAVNAGYHDEKLPNLKGNPMAEALPKAPDNQTLVDLFLAVPDPDEVEEMRTLDKEDRATLISCLRDILIPTEEYISTCKALFRMIRAGYRNRNPLKYEDLKVIREQEKINSQNYYKEIKRSGLKLNKGSIQENMTIIGVSGCGKTTTVNTFKRLMPNAILHNEYKGRLLRRVQIPVLHVVVPHNGSLKGLLQNILKAIDEALSLKDLKYYEWGVKSNLTENRLIMEVAKLVVMYSVGIIILDEAGNLTNNQSEKDAVSAFITNLCNVWQVPVAFLGTPNLESLMAKDLNVVRRMSSYGTRYWGKISEDTEDWDNVINTLWSVQYTKTYTPLTEKLKKTMYEVTQGIMSLVVSVFMFVQLRCLYDDDNPDEIIRVKDIKKVFQEDFKPVHKIIQAIRKDDYSELQGYSNVLLDVFDNFDIAKASYQERDKTTRLRAAVKKSQKESLNARMFKTLSDMTSFDCSKSTIKKIITNTIQHHSNLVQHDDLMQLIGIAFPEVLKANQEALEKKEKSKPKKKKESGLLSLYFNRVKEKKSCYQLFKENGYISEVSLE